MASTSASSALVDSAVKSEIDIESETSDIDVKMDYTDDNIKKEYTSDEIETAILSTLRTNAPLFTRRTPTGKVIDHHYLAVATFAGEALEIDRTFFYTKPWWPKLIEIVNDEIATLQAKLPTGLALRIDDALRATIASFVCTTIVDGAPNSVIDYAGIYRAVEAQLGVEDKFLSHNARYKELRRAAVKEEVAKLEAAARKAE